MSESDQRLEIEAGSCHLVARVLVLAVGRSRRDPFDANSSDYQNCLRSSSATRGSWPYSRGLRRERDRDARALARGRSLSGSRRAFATPFQAAE